MLENPVMKAVRAEIPFYPDVKMEPVDRGGKHRRILFTRGNERRFLTVPRSPSDHRASRNAVRDFRKTMRELGAERVGETETVHLPKRTGKRAKVASFGLGENLLVIHFPKGSKLLKRVRSATGKPMAHWEVYFRSSPDLDAPPMVALRRVELPAGQLRKQGVTGGFAANADSWRFTLSRKNFPMLDSIQTLTSVPLTLYEETTDELVFKLPSGTLPTTFRPRPEPVAPVMEPPEASDGVLVGTPFPAPRLAPIERRAEAAPQAATFVNDQPITLQLPKQGVSIEAAIAVLNKAKRRLGDNLRFTIVEGGYLTAVHRIGL